MNRRTQLKIEDARIFAKKYVFSGRFIVRNTLIAMGLATVIGSGVLTADIAKEVRSKNTETKTVSTMVAEKLDSDTVIEEVHPEKKEGEDKEPELEYKIKRRPQLLKRDKKFPFLQGNQES